MDVLQQIFRSNGKAINHLRYDGCSVGQERDRYYIRGTFDNAPPEIMTVYLSGEEIDRLAAVRRRQLEQQPTGIWAALGALAQLGGIRDSATVSRRPR